MTVFNQAAVSLCLWLSLSSRDVRVSWIVQKRDAWRTYYARETAADTPSVNVISPIVIRFQWGAFVFLGKTVCVLARMCDGTQKKAINRCVAGSL